MKHDKLRARVMFAVSSMIFYRRRSGGSQTRAPGEIPKDSQAFPEFPKVSQHFLKK
jgi:hypothetical protein